MMYELVLLACLASQPNSEKTCRALYSPSFESALFCEEQREQAMLSLREEGYRVYSFCVPVRPALEVRK